MKYFFICLLVSSSFCLLAQENKIRGKVFLPLIKKKVSIKRGSNYRNRLKRKTRNDTLSYQDLLARVVVSVKPLSLKPTLGKKVFVLNQKDKTFFPNVLAVSKGSTVQFINQDDFYHNVFSLTPGIKFNIGRRPPGKIVTKTIQKAGIIKVFCDIHPQMNAIIVSLETPYFTKVNEQGNYQIGNLPDGKYQLDFFHPLVKVDSETIVLKGGETLKKDFIMGTDSKVSVVKPNQKIRLTAEGTMLDLCASPKQ